MPAQSSGNVDERVVELRINDKKFESGAKKTISVLEQLDQSLNSLGKANASGFDTVADSLDKVTSKFSIMGTVGDQIIRNLTNKAMELVSQLTRVSRELTIDQIGAGWSKYAEKTQGVQTIMAATAKDWDDQAAQMEYVNEQLERLNWFTDETSYNFLDMVNNIGKFTSNGIALEQAVTAMQGIATWAAISGANTQEASRAMYNISQAMGSGAMLAIDWKSIENANMATREFKQIALETAAEYKTLIKLGDDNWRTLKDHDFTTNQFREQLSDKWFTAEVLTSTLEKYGTFASALYDATDASQLTASEFLKAMRLYEAGDEESMKEFNLLVSKSALSINELIPLIEELSTDEYDLGRRAFQAAQEAKTFREAIDATKDAVSTSWMNLFEKMFGSYLDAKKVWTDMAESLYNIFAEPVNRLNEIFDVAFGKEGPALTTGQQLFTEGFINILNVIENIAEALSQAFEAVFGSTGERGEQLYYLIERFNRFTKALKELSEEGITPLVEGELGPLAQKFAIVLSVLQSIGKVVKTAFRVVFDVIGKIVSKFFELYQALNANGALTNFALIFSTIFSAIVSIIDHITEVVPIMLVQAFDFIDGLKGMTFVQKIAEWIGALSEKILGLTLAFADFITSVDGSYLIDTVLTGILSVIGSIISVFTNLVSKIRSGFSYIKTVFQEGGIRGIFEAIFAKIINAFSNISAAIRDFVKDSPVLKGILAVIELAFGAIIGLAYGAYTAISNLFSIINFEKIKSYLPTMDSIREFFSSIGATIGNKFTNIREFFESFKEIGVFATISGKITNFFKSAKDFFSNFKIDLSGFSAGFEKVKQFFAFLFEGFLGNAEIVKEKVKIFIQNAWQGLMEGLKSITISDIYKVFKMERIVATVGLLFSITDAINRIGKKLADIPESISEMFSDLGDMFRDIGRSFKANYLLKMAAAVAIVTASLFVLSKIPEDRLTHIAAILVIVMFVLSRVFKAMTDSKIFNQKVNVQKIQVFGDLAGALFGIAAVLLAIGIAVAKIGKLGDPNLIWNTVFAMLGLIGGLAGILYLLIHEISKLSSIGDVTVVGKTLLRIAVSMFLIAAAVRMLVLPVITLATTMKAFGEGGGGLLWSASGILMVFMAILGGIMLAFTYFIASKGRTISSDKIKEIGNTMLKMAIAIAFVALAIGLLTVPLIALAVVLSLPIIGGKLLLAAGALIAFAVVLSGIFFGLAILANSKKLGMDPEKLRELGNTMLKMAAAILIVSLAITILIVPLMAIATAMATIGGVWGAIFALGLLVAILGGIIIGVSKFGGDGKSMLMIAAGIAVLAVALALLIPNLIMFSTSAALLMKAVKNMDGFWKALGKLAALGGVLIILGIGLTFVGVGALLIGTSMLVAGVGALLFVLALTALLKVIEGIAPAMKKFIDGLVEVGESITKDTLGNLIKGVVVFVALAAAVWLLGRAFGNLLGKEGVADKLDTFASSIGKFVGKIVSVIGTVLKSIGSELVKHLPSIQTVIVALITIVGLFVAGAIPSLVNTIGTAIISLLASLYLFIKNNRKTFEFYIFGLVAEIMNILNDALTWAISMLLPALMNIIVGSFADFLRSIPGLGKAADWLESDMSAYTETIQEKLQHSFSRNENFWSSVNPFGDTPPEVHQITEEQAASLGIDYEGGLRQAAETISTAAVDLKDTVATSVGNAFTVNTGDGSPVVEGAESVANTGTGTLIDTITANIPGIQDSGFNIGSGLATGMDSSQGLVRTAAGALGDIVPAEISSHLQIKSPSRVMAKLAAWIPAGMAKGIEENTGVATDSMTILSSAVLAAMQEAMLRIATVADDNFEFNPTITPVVDLSNVTAAAGSAGSIFGGVSASMHGAVRVAADNAQGTMAALQYNDGSENVVNEIQLLGDRIDRLGDAVANMRIVLDTGVLVGATSNKMDAAFGVMQMRKERGN